MDIFIMTYTGLACFSLAYLAYRPELKLVMISSAK